MKKLYIVHGWTYNLDKWTAVCKALQARGIEPVLLKVPGLTTPSDKVWDIDGYIEWLKSELSGVNKPVVLGHSNGGRIGLAFDQKYPGVLGKLILLDSAGLAHNEVIPRTKLTVLKGVSKVGKPLKKIPLVGKAFYKVIGAQDYNQAPPNMKATMGNMLAADKQIDLSKVTVPISMIWGRDDTTTPLKDGQKMRQLLGNPPMEIVDGARHAPQATHPEQVADLIAKVLA